MDLVSVDGLPRRYRLSAWQELVSRAFVPVEVTGDPHALVRGRIESTELGPLRVSEVTSDVQRVRRTPQVISSSDPQCYLITMALREDAVVLQVLLDEFYSFNATRVETAGGRLLVTTPDNQADDAERVRPAGD